ncbi:xanthine dehydrogenase [Methylocystis bryophila]|uniref:Xanthine dehydrogenase n=1 Tax=Methylocystis bryophila TaxID=655015 RepID=A0A1W6MTR7_9HYPH|nr:xanthine dehydrogenase [Methylocystis bryophila]ARN81000.1 xanthine dehydrogenase [Methylocystis bryophila]
MSKRMLDKFLEDRSAPFVLILGTNEIASAVAVRLRREGGRVLMCHDPFPPVIRRGMAFYDVLFDDQVEIDEIPGRRVGSTLEIGEALASGRAVAVTELQLSDVIPLRIPDILIDARIQKHRVTPDLRKTAGLSIGLGPNFTAGFNCDIAVETHPAHTGELLATGATRASDGVPRYLGGVGRERFVYAARSGVWRTPLDIGARVFKGYVMGRLDGLPVPAPMDGRLRGIARDDILVPQGVKLIEIDPRGTSASWTGTDERGRAIAEATVTAIRTNFIPSVKNARMAVTLH